MKIVNDIKDWFRKVGDKLSTKKELSRVIDHPKIAVSLEEYNRIQENKQFYSNKFPPVHYLNFENIKKEREYSSINATKIMAGELASLVFNEGCKISLDNDAAQKYLDPILRESKFNKNFREELEAGYAISGLALRPYVDPKSKTIKISYCSADTFFPLNSNSNDVSEAAIVTVTQEVKGKDTFYYTLIEFHEWLDNGKYMITNELYESKRSDIVGRSIPLTSNDKFKDISPVTVLEGITRPLFVYIKLAGKNNIELGSPLGIGVADNAKTQFTNLNDTYDQYMHEVKKSKTRLMMSDHFLKVRYGENGQPKSYLDPNTDVYQLFKGDMDEAFMKEFVPSLRTDEYISTMNFILQIAETDVGFSPGSFSFDVKEGIKTATEVVSENSKTFRTRADNVLLIEEAMKELVVTIFELATAFGLFKGSRDFNINVDFDDGVFTTKDEKVEYYLKLVNSSLLSKKSAMMKALDMSEVEAEQELKLIAKESLGKVFENDSEISQILNDRLLFGSQE